MLTYIDSDRPTLERDDRAAYRPFRVEVVAVRRMAPHFTRITFRGEHVNEFGTDRQDQRIKLVFPVGDGDEPDFGVDDPASILAGDWYARLRALPVERRPAFRTYTVRDIRPADRELDVDFVDHGVQGPAARWLQTAAVGQQLVVVGPTVRSIHSAGGIDWHPGPATRVLLAGDETAAPAICAILERLPDDIRATAFIEVPDARDALELARNGSRVTWLARGDGVHGTVLEPAVRDWIARHRDALAHVLVDSPAELVELDVDQALLWDSPEDARLDFYAWLAGEAAMIKSLRRFLVSETGVDRHQVAFMGYWRLGRAEAQE